jgi:hypothetical protein
MVLKLSLVCMVGFFPVIRMANTASKIATQEIIRLIVVSSINDIKPSKI